jgi:hypothetical protein
MLKMMCLWASTEIRKKNYFFASFYSMKKESDPELDPDPHKNVTDPQH